jgi:hypothetical protein
MYTSRSSRHIGVKPSVVPDEHVVEVLAFETADPALRGEMTISTKLTESNGGTKVTVVYEDEGTRMTLDNLAALVEGGFSAEY